MFEDALALLIGISDYINQEHFPRKLEKIFHAHNDAAYMKKALLHLGYLKPNVICLYNHQATQSNILEAFNHIWNEVEKSADRQVLLFYAGHAWGDTYMKTPITHLMPYDVEVRSLESRKIFNRGIDVEWLAKALKNLNAKRKTMFLDTCYSGGINRGVMYGQLSASNTAFLASCGEEEFSIECDGNRNHGIFTVRLVEALCGLGGSNTDGTVSVHHVGNHVQAKVPKDAEALLFQQTPVVIINSKEPFPIGRNTSDSISSGLATAPLPPTIRHRLQRFRS